jgi:hypothetical protein
MAQHPRPPSANRYEQPSGGELRSDGQIDALTILVTVTVTLS